MAIRVDNDVILRLVRRLITAEIPHRELEPVFEEEHFQRRTLGAATTECEASYAEIDKCIVNAVGRPADGIIDRQPTEQEIAEFCFEFGRLSFWNLPGRKIFLAMCVDDISAVNYVGLIPLPK